VHHRVELRVLFDGEQPSSALSPSIAMRFCPTLADPTAAISSAALELLPAELLLELRLLEVVASLCVRTIAHPPTPVSTLLSLSVTVFRSTSSVPSLEGLLCRGWWISIHELTRSVRLELELLDDDAYTSCSLLTLLLAPAGAATPAADPLAAGALSSSCVGRAGEAAADSTSASKVPGQYARSSSTRCLSWKVSHSPHHSITPALPTEHSDDNTVSAF
jgi:hypothetical protein